MGRYLIIHNTHNGCYDFQCYEDQEANMRLTSITINPPRIFMFHTKEQAQEYFEDYISDIDIVDNRCKKGEEVSHIDYCTCGIIELDDDDNPILFYNKRNQIFLLEHGADVFIPPQELKNDIKNLNITNKVFRRCKSLNIEQRKRYIELGKFCEECNEEEMKLDNDATNLNVSNDANDASTNVPTNVPTDTNNDDKNRTISVTVNLLSSDPLHQPQLLQQFSIPADDSQNPKPVVKSKKEKVIKEKAIKEKAIKEKAITEPLEKKIRKKKDSPKKTDELIK